MIKFTDVFAQAKLVAAAMILLSTISMGPICAQSTFRYAPASRQTPQRCRTVSLHAPSAVTGSSEQILEVLRGVMIVSDENQLSTWIKPFDGIKVHPAAEVTVAQDPVFQQAIQPYIGGRVSQGTLNQMVQQMVQAYRISGRPAVDVHVPSGQEVTEGIVQVIVSEATIGNIIVQGNCNFDDCSLLQYNWLQRGDSVYVPCIENELKWLNRNPYRNVHASLQPGNQPGTADVVYHVSDESPISYFVGYSDSGPQTTGRERLSVGFDYANAFGKDRRLGYQYTTDAELAGRIDVHSLTYQIPIPDNRDTFNLYAEWGNVDTTFDSPAGMRNQSDGYFWQLSGRYQHDLCDEKCRLDKMEFGFDFKGADNFADYGLFPAVNSGPEVHTLNLMLGVSSYQEFDDGYTNYGGEIFVSPGGLLPNNHARDFKRVRREAKATYAYARGFLERLYHVNQNSDFFFRLTGQVASGPLLPSEQLGFGGYNSVRGYDMRTLNGDSGYILNMEYRSKPMIKCWNGKSTSLTALAFSDIAQQANLASGAALPDDEFFASVGVGFRFDVDPNCSIRFDYGIPLRTVEADRKHSNGRIHLGAVLLF